MKKRMELAELLFDQKISDIVNNLVQEYREAIALEQENRIPHMSRVHTQSSQEEAMVKIL
jgi:hypothetical protein